MAVAESVTPGLLQVALAAGENATAFFQDGISVYNAKQKFTHLQVDLLHALSCNCFLDALAIEISVDVGKSFVSDWGIGITGYSSPSPGHDMNPLYAHYAVSIKNHMVKSGKIISGIKSHFKFK